MATGFDSVQLTRALDTLVARELIKRTLKADNRRAVEINLTAKGKRKGTSANSLGGY